MPERADAVIVGAGYTGLAAARMLARAGASVVVVERESIGWGASSRNGGQVVAGLRLDATALVARYGEARARQFFDVSLEAIARLEALLAEESIACDYERVGHLEAAAKPAHFEAFRTEQVLLGRVFAHRVELLSRTEQHAEIGSEAYHGVMIDERSAALNPAMYVSGLEAAARRAGVLVATQTAVTCTEARNGRWLVETTRGQVDAGDVLFATNGYTDGASPALQRRFVPVGSHIVATVPLRAEQAAPILPRRRVAFDSKHLLHYFRLTSDNRLLFGGRAEPDVLCRDLVRVFPSLAGVAVEYAWGGNVAFTRDQMPHAGKLEGRYYAGGYCGHGIAMATRLGEQIARRMAGEPIVQPLFDDRFPPIPFYSGRPWFLPLAGAYFRVKDWLQ